MQLESCIYDTQINTSAKREVPKQEKKKIIKDIPANRGKLDTRVKTGTQNDAE